jgi:hypothetical protein
VTAARARRRDGLRHCPTRPRCSQKQRAALKCGLAGSALDLFRDKPGYPHEISIDLGAEYELVGMRYLARQDGNPNGLIADYEFYASLDSNAWGAAVSSGTFPDGTSEKKLTFAAKRARYVRLRGLSGVGGRVYASVAELNVIAK